MKLHYFKDPLGNFGDDLNAWLWPRLIPDLLDDDPDALFVGIGTLINHRLPAAPHKHVFGSGYGYGQPPQIDERWHFHAVRGPDTARALGLPPHTAVTDAAVLVRAVDRPAAAGPRSTVGAIFTGQSLAEHDWQQVCEPLGVRFISCHWDVERVMREMLACDVLLCEAMHGAIVADALRVPWIPITCNEDILAFKWQDWLSTLSLRYEPSRVTPLHRGHESAGAAQRLKNGVKRALQRGGLWASRWQPPPPRPSGAADIERAGRELLAAAARAPYASSEALLDRHVDELLGRLQRLRRERRRT